MIDICKNIKSVRDVVGSVKSVSAAVDIVAVTKFFPCQDVLEALRCGITHIGESRIQEALPKFAQINTSLCGITKHFIGRLQSNKIQKIVKNFDLIHSLDNIKYAYHIDRCASGFGKIQDCLIEVKVSKEIAKIGVNPDDVKNFYKQCLSIKNILIRGLMVITPCGSGPQDSRSYFVQVHSLFEDIKASFGNPSFNVLSMGMSCDYKVAVEEGATTIRIGSAIFGERDYENG